MPNIDKARMWCGVLYQENMVQDWRTDIGDILQLPFAYCEHTLDVDANSEHRKDHVHLIIVFPNTTTYKHALKVFELLSKPGYSALNTVQAVINIRSMYDYLIHDTETCRKKGKYVYSPQDRITGNNFDIGSFEQISVAEKNAICKEMCQVIIDNEITNFADFYMFFATHEDTNYFECLKTYSGLFERLTKAMYLKNSNKN